MAYIYVPGVPCVVESQTKEALEYVERVSRALSIRRSLLMEEQLQKIVAENKGWRVVQMEIHKGERWGDDLRYVRLRRGHLWWKKEKLVFLSDKFDEEGKS